MAPVSPPDPPPPPPTPHIHTSPILPVQSWLHNCHSAPPPPPPPPPHAHTHSVTNHTETLLSLPELCWLHNWLACVCAVPSCVDVPKVPWLEVPRTGVFLVCPWGTPALTVPLRRRLQQPRWVLQLGHQRGLHRQPLLQKTTLKPSPEENSQPANDAATCQRPVCSVLWRQRFQ